MSFSFVITSLSIIVLIGLIVGTAVKLWMYGIKDLLLLLSPIILVTGVVVAPIYLINLIIFHPIKIKNALKLENFTIWSRLKAGISFFVIAIQFYPFFVGIIAKALSSSFDLKLILRHIIQSLISVDDYWGKGPLSKVV